MADKLNLHRTQIEISGDRVMNIYTFDLDGTEMPEMSKEDVVPTTHPDVKSTE